MRASGGHAQDQLPGALAVVVLAIARVKCVLVLDRCRDCRQLVEGCWGTWTIM